MTLEEHLDKEERKQKKPSVREELTFSEMCMYINGPIGAGLVGGYLYGTFGAIAATFFGAAVSATNYYVTRKT